MQNFFLQRVKNCLKQRDSSGTLGPRIALNHGHYLRRSAMTETREEWIKKRAYALWEEEGRPAGRDFAHWEQAHAERQALEGSAASLDGKEVKTRKRTASPKASTATPKTNGAVKAVAPKKTASRKSA
ncbi:tRNA(Leu) C34 or U34 (ribose-2'-O)-methylase TrmL [Rhizobium mesoamericanum]|nr:tRNA(Leu) C34 or U34 (ribose-2'-O)-methylase TrmL [Rhizobium mesoamericanum]